MTCLLFFLRIDTQRNVIYVMILPEKFYGVLQVAEKFEDKLPGAVMNYHWKVILSHFFLSKIFVGL